MNLRFTLAGIISLANIVLKYYDKSLIILIVFMVLDYLTGICKAIYFKNINSKIGLKGIIKKFGYFIIIALSTGLDIVLNCENYISTLLIYFFIANEGISILENWGSMGLPLPKKITDVLINIKDKT